MALRINENKGVIYLEGNINSTNSNYVKQHIKYAMNSYRDLKLDIKQITSIDKDGISCLKSIQAYASKNFRELIIVKDSSVCNLNMTQIGA